MARERYTYDADGNLTGSWVAGDMNCDGVVNSADINPFTAAILCAYASPICCEQCWLNQGRTCPYLNADINGDGSVSMGDINPFVALQSSGNAAVARAFAWDAENRLVGVTPLAPLAGAQRVEFRYDYLGRRVEKRVYNWDVQDPNNPHWDTTPAAVRRFVWSGWLMLLELDGLNENAVLKKYTWGLDLAGLVGQSSALPAALQAAGGIGGLLAMQDVQDPNDPNDNLNYIYLYDANGNVGQLVDWTHDPNDPAGAIAAAYEYDPYGNVTSASGAYAEENPFRFSTKYWDDETGLGYWGYRYYNSALGRWLNRDPIGELGGANLYAYVGNDPVNWADVLGLAMARCMSPPCGGDWWRDSGSKTCPRKGRPAWTPGPNGQTNLPNYIVDWHQLLWLLELMQNRPFLVDLQDYLNRLPYCDAGCQWLKQVIQQLIDLMERQGGGEGDAISRFVELLTSGGLADQGGPPGIMGDIGDGKPTGMPSWVPPNTVFIDPVRNFLTIWGEGFVGGHNLFFGDSDIYLTPERIAQLAAFMEPGATLRLFQCHSGEDPVEMARLTMLSPNIIYVVGVRGRLLETPFLFGFSGRNFSDDPGWGYWWRLEQGANWVTIRVRN